jgi:hypothetical protein
LPLPDSPGRLLPRLFSRCPGFDNDCPDFWWGEHPREPRCPESKTSRPGLGNDCPDSAGHCPGFKNDRPGLASHCPGNFQLCPDFQTLAPFLKTAAPIPRTPRQFHNLLLQSKLDVDCGDMSPLSKRGHVRALQIPTFNPQPSTIN